MTITQKIFQHQIWHLLSALFLILILQLYLSANPSVFDGSLWGIRTQGWFWLAVVIPVVHQAYVWLVWRLELYRQVFTVRWGVQRAFKLYAFGFSILFVSRLIAITLLAVSSRDTLGISPMIAYVLAAVITPLVGYLFYSVKRYFTVERAYGIDHFDKNYDKPFVKKGIFRYTDNGMYVFGLMILYLPGLLLLSEAALWVALFNHLFIWAHYYCTERPDMVAIYGTAPSESQ